MVDFWFGFFIALILAYFWHLGDSAEKAKEDAEYEKEIVRKQIEKRGGL